MAKPFEGSTQRSRETLISVTSVGAFLILLGLIIISTPDFFGKLLSFFNDFDLIQVPNVIAGVRLPAPRHPANHTAIYSAASWFSFGWGIFLVAMLLVRILANSPLQKKAENASDIFNSLANGFLIGYFLNGTTNTVMWFSYWTALIMLLGISLLIRGLILAFYHLIR
jgi:hypothetical protein